MLDYDYHRPTTLDEVRRLLQANPNARLISGGTDLLVRMRRGLEKPGALISLKLVTPLRTIEVGRDGARIGAGVTLSEILAAPLLADRFPVLAEAITSMAGVQIRNSGTIGGNLANASPAADTAPPLLVLGASVVVSGDGGAREVSLDELFVGPGRTRLLRGEVLTYVLIPPPSPAARSIFLKKGRVAGDIATASVAASVDLAAGGRLERVRLAAGAVAPTPIRLREAEKALEGQPADASVIARAAEIAEAEVSPISDVRASADYRRALIGAFVRRAITRLSSTRSA